MTENVNYTEPVTVQQLSMNLKNFQPTKPVLILMVIKMFKNSDAIYAVPIKSTLSTTIVNRWFAADFETPTIKTKHFANLKDPSQNRINAACFIDLEDPTDKPNLSVTVPEFLDQLFNNLKTGEIGQVFMHNLSKFDGYALIDWLRNNLNLTDESAGNTSIKWDRFNFDRSWSFAYKDGKIYKIEVIDKKFKKAILFTCSLLLLSSSLAALGKIVGHEKTETDYNVEPANNLTEYPQQYIDYLINDVVVLKKALLMFKRQLADISQQLFKNNSISWNRLTAASVSRELISSFNVKGLKIKQKEQLKASEYYYGGFTNFNLNYQDKITNKKLKIFDAKSHYPTQMATKQLPTGHPYINRYDPEMSPYRHDRDHMQTSKKIADWDFITITGTIEKALTPWGTIKKINRNFLDPIYELGENQEFIFKGTWFEWQQVRQFYRFKQFYLMEWCHFETTTDIFKQIINPLYKAKETQSNPLTFKIILNSLYGSIGLRARPYKTVLTNINNTLGTMPITLIEHGKHKPAAHYSTPFDFQPFTSQDLIIIDAVPVETPEAPEWFDELDPDHWDLTREPSKGCWNVWTAAAITSFARSELFKVILIDPDNIVYCDTDSVFILESEKLEDHFKKVSGNDLGCWSEEYADITLNKFHIVQPKMYAVWSNEKLIKLGAVGVSKSFLKEIWESDHTYLQNNTTLESATNRVAKGLTGEYLNYLKDPEIFKKIPRWSDSTFPWIIESDKSLNKVKQLRQKELNNGMIN